MLRRFEIHDQTIVEAHDAAIADPDILARASWIDAQDPSRAERAALAGFLGAELPVGDDVEEIESSARYFVDADGVHVHSLFLSQSEGRHETDTVAFILQPARLITLRDDDLAARSPVRETAREILHDLDTLMSHIAFLFDKINFLMDSTQGFINIEQSQIIKTFSIAAVVFLPPTLIASIYGMNFQHMPELSWTFGYPFSLVAMVAAGIAPYAYFKYKNWL